MQSCLTQLNFYKSFRYLLDGIQIWKLGTIPSWIATFAYHCDNFRVKKHQDVLYISPFQDCIPKSEFHSIGIIRKKKQLLLICINLQQTYYIPPPHHHWRKALSHVWDTMYVMLISPKSDCDVKNNVVNLVDFYHSKYLLEFPNNLVYLITECLKLH